VNPAVCRIKAFSCQVVQTGADGHATAWRPTKYTAQLGTDASMLHSNKTSLSGIARDWTMRAIAKRTQWGDAGDKDVWTRPLIIQSEAT
jgi:hypothetical protein